MEYKYGEREFELLKKIDQKLAEDRTLSQKKLAKLIGVHDGTLSQIRRGEYKANPSKIFDIIENYFSVKEKAKLTYSEIGYAQTSISSEIYNIIRVCQVKG